MLTCMLRQDPQGGLVYQLAGEVSMGPQELICVSPLGCTSPMWPAGRLMMGLAWPPTALLSAWSLQQDRVGWEVWGLAPASPASRCLDLWLWGPQISLLGESRHL